MKQNNPDVIKAIVAGIAVYKNKRLDRYFSQTDWVKAIRDYFFCRNDTDYFKLYNEVMAGTYD
ncbi:hypothetical protein H0R92_10930 [Treponema sp. OMZ 840]|uniref:hypothetical protein n=1 Tax=Treponema sp. OMZ 840 TaxID=244313 RepID=UPI003D9050EC